MFNSRKVQQPVRVFHDEALQKFRLCPVPEGSTVNTSDYGVFFFLCGKLAMVGSLHEDESSYRFQIKASRGRTSRKSRRAKRIESHVLATAGFYTANIIPQNLPRAIPA